MVGGERLTFGFEGIWQGTAVLYDHQTRSLWMHLTGECFDGKHAGTVLARVPTGRHTTWADWKGLHPATEVLALVKALVGRADDTGYFPRESSRAGEGYFPPTFVPTIQSRDARLAPHELLYGVVVGGQARAYPYRRLQSAGLVEERLGKVPITVWFDRKARSAAAFDRRVGENELRFQRDPDGSIRDQKTRSRWTLDGVCVEGARQGVQLTPLRGLQAEWYGWYAFHPKTTLWRQY